MRKAISVMTIIAFAVIGIGMGADYFINTDNARLAPVDLTQFNRSAFESSLFEGYVGVDNVASYTTPSQAAILEDNEEDGRPMGNVSPKRAFIGSSNNLTPKIYPVI